MDYTENHGNIRIPLNQISKMAMDRIYNEENRQSLYHKNNDVVSRGRPNLRW